MVSGLHFYRFNGRVIVRPKLAHNGLQIGDVAGLGALNFQFTTKDFSSTTVQITTEPAISANVLLRAGLLFNHFKCLLHIFSNTEHINTT